MRVGIPVADLCAGMFAAQGAMLALLEREESGQGQWVRTSLLEAQIQMLDFQAARYLKDQEIPGQAGNDHPTSIPTGVFPTSDGHINIAVAGGEGQHCSHFNRAWRGKIAATSTNKPELWIDRWEDQRQQQQCSLTHE